MDDTGLPQITDELSELSALPTQDIPTAVREPSGATAELKRTAPQPSSLKPSGLRHPLVLGLGFVALLTLPLGLLLRSQILSALPQSAPVASASLVNPGNPTTPQPLASPTALLGHLLYPEAPAAELMPLSAGGISLRKAAAKKFEEMLDAAAGDGVVLSTISGFRSIAEQNTLFFDVKAERGEDSAKRAAVSAPPGYSEHHTGYAVDIGDADAPSADLQFTFDQTKAFKWLKENAAHYSFEMSFPKGNPMGVNYEPWHWRYVGDRQSLETFYRARAGTASAPQAAPAPDSTSSPSAPQK